jgi:uncharacterized protein YkwD
MLKFFFPIVLIGFSLTFAACSGNEDDTMTFFENAPANPDKALLLKLVNDLRATGGQCGSAGFSAASALTWNDTLAIVARKHSQDMAANGKLSHTGTDGSFVDQRLAREGYVWTFYAENLLKGGATEQDAIQIWMNSEGHCKNILNPNLKEMGVGTSGPFWTMVLASH